MNTLLIGDESATTLGIDVTNVRKIYLAFSAAVTGILVAAVGVISFTGLVIPHIVRMIVGSDHRYVIPLSVIVGSIFMIWCDVVSKIILKNGELPIGIITSMVGEGLSLFG
ncbi:putative vitamin B12 permease (fragment) [Clostridiaceae bacterium BL-3]